MTPTRQRSAERTIAVGKLGDAALVELTVELENEIRRRARATSDAGSGVLFGRYFAAQRGCYAPDVDGLERSLREARERIRRSSGRITLAYRVTPHIRDANTGEDLPVPAGDERFRPHDIYSHLEIANLRDGQVIPVEVPFTAMVYTRTVVSPTQVELPSGWASQLAQAFQALPAPQVTVDAPAITVEAPQVNVAVPDPAKTITIERHPSGLIKGATVEASA